MKIIIIVPFLFMVFVVLPVCSLGQDITIGHTSLDISFNAFLKNWINYDIVEQESGAVSIYKNGKLLLLISDKGNNDKIVRMVHVFSPDIRTTGGIFVGMPVLDVIKIFPGLTLENFTSDGEDEYFAPPPLQKMAPDGSYDIVTLVHVNALTGEDDHFPTSNFRTDGAVTSISIFKWH
jgi:hypothetical protein